MTATSKRQMKSAARLYSVQALFQMEASDVSWQDVREEFLNHRFGAVVDEDEFVEGDVDLFDSILKTAVAEQARIDQLTHRGLVAKWPLARIDPTLRALFRAAGAELVGKETPPKVAINEYVDVAKAFFPDGKESKFVNAVLDHMAREVHPEAFA